jgi:alanyl-tRNA synthetase
VDAADELLTLADGVREQRRDAVVLLLAAADGRVAAVVAAGDAAVGRGLHAQDVLRAMMPAVDGKGGGKATLARGGGSNVDGIAAGLAAGLAKAREQLEP